MTRISSIFEIKYMNILNPIFEIWQLSEHMQSHEGNEMDTVTK